MKYRYKAFVDDVYDGDTITVEIDLGFSIYMARQKIRLYGINTPEVRGDERELGLIAKQYVSDAVHGNYIELETHKDKTGKYGRWLGIVHLGDRNINEELVELGLAVVNFYK